MIASARPPAPSAGRLAERRTTPFVEPRGEVVVGLVERAVVGGVDGHS